jgi:hypothetical protein
MRWRGGQDDDVMARALRDERPEPSNEYVRELSERIEREMTRATMRPRRRFVLALTTAALALGVVAASGGMGFAASSAATVAKHAVAPVKRAVVPARESTEQSQTAANVSRSTVASKPASDKAGPANDQYEVNKITICHRTGSGRGVTLTIARAALPAHLAHGDTVGSC